MIPMRDSGRVGELFLYSNEIIAFQRISFKYFIE